MNFYRRIIPNDFLMFLLWSPIKDTSFGFVAQLPISHFLFKHAFSLHDLRVEKQLPIGSTFLFQCYLSVNFKIRQQSKPSDLFFEWRQVYVTTRVMETGRQLFSTIVSMPFNAYQLDHSALTAVFLKEDPSSVVPSCHQKGVDTNHH